MSQFEADIIRKLSAGAAEPAARFAHNLHQELLKREESLKTNVMPPRRQPMNIKKLSMALVALIVLAGALAFVFMSKDKNNNDIAQTQPQSTTTPTQSSALPSQNVQSIEEARKSLTFKPLLPTARLDGENISNIKLGTKSNMIDDSDTIYLTYADTRGTLYKISESSKSFNDPTDAQKVALNVQGSPVTAYFYQLGQPESGSSINSAGNEASPTSYMFWYQNGVRYEISEFGRVSKDQLIQIANSFK